MAYEYFPEPRSPAEMGALTHDESMRILAQRNEAACRATLVESLMVMGRWDEAFTLEADPDKQLWIAQLKEGEERDDAERCECVHMVDTSDYVRFGQMIEAGEMQPTLEQHPHYLKTLRHWSSKHGEMVWAHRCHLCGHMQSIPGDIDDTHAAHAEKQMRQMQIEYAKPGAKVRKL